MRLPVVSQISTKDGVSAKNARLTNCLKETTKRGDMAVIRPGLVTQAEATGVGGGLVVFDNKLVSVYGSTFNISYEPGPADWSNYTTVLAGVNAGVPTFGNDMFMSVSSGRVSQISENGVTWQTKGTIGGSATWHYLASDGTNFVALPVSDGTTYTSSDLGATWTAHASAIGIATPPISEASIYFNGTYYLAAVVDDDTTPTMWRSSNGSTWTHCGDRPVAQDAAPNSWATGAGVTLVCSGGTGSAYSDDDGITWNDSALPLEAAYAAFGNGTFVVIDSVDAFSYTSPTGLSFSTNVIPTLTSPSSSKLLFNGVEFVLIDGGSITFHTSPDGIDWTSHTNTSGSTYGSSAVGNGTIVMVNTTNRDCATYAPPVNIPTLVSSVVIGNYDFAQSPI